MVVWWAGFGGCRGFVLLRQLQSVEEAQGPPHRQGRTASPEVPHASRLTATSASEHPSSVVGSNKTGLKNGSQTRALWLAARVWCV